MREARGELKRRHSIGDHDREKDLNHEKYEKLYYCPLKKGFVLGI